MRTETPAQAKQREIYLNEANKFIQRGFFHAGILNRGPITLVPGNFIKLLLSTDNTETPEILVTNTHTREERKFALHHTKRGTQLTLAQETLDGLSEYERDRSFQEKGIWIVQFECNVQGNPEVIVPRVIIACFATCPPPVTVIVRRSLG